MAIELRDLERKEVKPLEKEIWKTIEDFPIYEVSNLGHVRNKKTKELKKTFYDNDGYEKVTLISMKNGKQNYRKTVHRLVAEAFLSGKHPELQVNHKNGIKNDNKLSNLEWVTGSQNVKHAYDAGLRKPSGGRGPIRPIKVLETGKIYENLHDCAKAIKSDSGNVSKCLHGNCDTVKGYHLRYADENGKTFLYDYQLDAVNKLHNGSILNGSVGSGKSRTGLFYYFKENGGWIDETGYTPMDDPPQDLYIITTAKKRDSLEWEKEMIPFLISTHSDVDIYQHKVVIDSWNNLPKYKDIKGSFFLFDEQRLVSNGTWVKTFLTIAKTNNWILLTATPGDSYSDYVPVFIANGFFKNRTEFNREHVIYSRFVKYPKIDRYIGTTRLDRLRDKILVKMNYKHEINTYHEDIYCGYDLSLYKEIQRERWDIYKNQPILNASGLCYLLRKVANSDESRQVKLMELLEDHPRIIVFYNFDYELDILKSLHYGDDVEVAEWNGHKHQPIPDSEKWIYLCQYNSCSEGWECTKTNCIVFYSQNYSYKIMQQAAGRIDRLNTPYIDLYYYHFKSRSGIDLAISKALKEKKNFNEGKFVKW